MRLYNTSSEKLEAWGCCQLVSENPLKMRDGEPTWDVEIVTDEGLNTQDPWRFVFLLDRPIGPEKTGRGTQDWPVLTRGTDEPAGGGGFWVAVDGERLRAEQLRTISPKAGSQSLDGLMNMFAQLGPLGAPDRSPDSEAFGTDLLRYVTPVRQNFPSRTTVGGKFAESGASSGAAIRANVTNAYDLSGDENTHWFRIPTSQIDGENLIYIDFPGWYSVQFTARVSAAVDVAGIVSLGVRFIEGDDETETDEYTEADHQPIVMPSETGLAGSPEHSHIITYDGADYGEALTINPNIWLGLTILHRFTKPGSFHFRNFGLLDVTLQEFYWTATFRGPNYGA